MKKISLTPFPEKFEDIPDADWINLIENIMLANGSEVDIDYWLQLLEVNFSNPNISDLIYWPERENMSAEEIFEKIKSYQTICL